MQKKRIWNCLVEKHRPWRFCALLVLFVFFIFLTACAQPLQRPFTINNAKIVRSSTGACYKIAGIELSLYNSKAAYINKLRIYARLYAVSQTGSGSKSTTSYRGVPTHGKNEIKRVIDVSIAGKERSTVCIPLDDKLSALPTKKLLAKPFYIEQVSYDSGEVWKDTQGIYRQGIAE